MPEHRYDDDCSFCAIARGSREDLEVVCETPNWVAFFPLEPATPGHTLIIPKTHVADYWDLDAEQASDLSLAALQVGQAIQRAISPEGMNLITSAGQAAEQSVFHLHLHVVPRWRRDGFGEIWPHGHRYEDSELVDVADRIRSECSDEKDTGAAQ
jgi:histidine triad (HIT) family protein